MVLIAAPFGGTPCGVSTRNLNWMFPTRSGSKGEGDDYVGDETEWWWCIPQSEGDAKHATVELAPKFHEIDRTYVDVKFKFSFQRVGGNAPAISAPVPGYRQGIGTKHHTRVQGPMTEARTTVQGPRPHVCLTHEQNLFFDRPRSRRLCQGTSRG
jgi:hypothetical protein